MDAQSQDRQLPASERKLQKAREEGQVARSRDLGHLAVLGGGALCLMWLSPWLFDQLSQELSLQLTFDANTLKDPENLVRRLSTIATVGAMACAVFGLVVNSLSVASALATGGWVSSLKPISPDLSRLSPLKGLGQLFSKEKFTEILKISFIAGMLIAVGYRYLLDSLGSLGQLVLLPSNRALELMSEWLTHGMGWMLLIVLLVAVVDMPLQQFLHKSRLKMSHQEMKQEHKDSDGNPQMKSRMRQRQREMANSNSIQAVPKADFVLMNPTHYAVAVCYDETSMGAPRVIAKGADLLAWRIRDMATEHKVPVLQSPVLARALYAHTELNAEIPAALYTAVAQVLAYIYRLKAAMKGHGPMPTEVPQPFVPPELDPHSKVVAAEVTEP